MNIILDLPQDHFAACSFLRQSLALSLIHEHAVFSGPSNKNLSEETSAKIETFASLARRDPDACATALRQAASIGSENAVYASQTTELLARISARLLFDDAIVDIEVQDAAQEVLRQLFSHGATDVVRSVIIGDLKSLSLPTSKVTPLFSDKRLVLQGALFNFKMEDESLQTTVSEPDFQEWVVEVRSALQESNVSTQKLFTASRTLTSH